MGNLWVSQFCEQAEFVIKTDDDMFVDLYAVYFHTRHHVIVIYFPKKKLLEPTLVKRNSVFGHKL